MSEEAEDTEAELPEGSFVVPDYINRLMLYEGPFDLAPGKINQRFSGPLWKFCRRRRGEVEP